MYVDITRKPVVTAVEWFHGYGGNALGLKRAIPGLQSVAVCERDAFVVANMVSKMEKGLLDAVPIWTDVTDFPTEPFGRGRLDLFVASYPCQGFSHAGKRLGTEDHRHLWPYCRKFIGAVRPGWVWLENVEGHVSLGLSTVLADLEEDGYAAAWGIFSASEVGAPHQRKRVFILAYDKEQRLEGYRVGGSKLQRAEAVGAEVFNRTSLPGGTANELALSDSLGLPHGEPEILPTETGLDAQRDAAASGGEDVAHHHHHQGLQGLRERGGQTGREVEDGHIGSDSQVWPSRPGERQYAWEPPRVVGNADTRRGIGGDKNKTESGRKMGECSIEGADRHGGPDGNSQTQPPMGGGADGLAAGVDFPGCTGLNDTELEEIYGWMVKGTNRTDELRMCGNGVVPQTAERAFRVLFAELQGRLAGADDAVLGGDHNGLD